MGEEISHIKLWKVREEGREKKKMWLSVKKDGLRGRIRGEKKTKMQKQRGSTLDDNFHMSESAALPPSISLSMQWLELVVPSERERD